MDKKQEDNLKYAIQRAIDNGFSPFGDARVRIADTVIVMLNHMAKMGDVKVEQPGRVILFDKKFAKALWGEDPIKQSWDDISLWSRGVDTHYGHMTYSYAEGGDVKLVTPAWKYHLQNMVVDEEPLNYLGENING